MKKDFSSEEVTKKSSKAEKNQMVDSIGTGTANELNDTRKNAFDYGRKTNLVKETLQFGRVRRYMSQVERAQLDDKKNNADKRYV